MASHTCLGIWSSVYVPRKLPLPSVSSSCTKASEEAWVGSMMRNTGGSTPLGSPMDREVKEEVGEAEEVERGLERVREQL